MSTDLFQVAILSLAGFWGYRLHRRHPAGRLPLLLTLYLCVPIGGLALQHLIPGLPPDVQWVGVFLNAGLTASLIETTLRPFPGFTSQPPPRDPDPELTRARIRAYALAYRALDEIPPLLERESDRRKAAG